MKDVIYPTIRKKFNEMTPVYTDKEDYLEDKNGVIRIAFFKDISTIAIVSDFFMLHYFGLEGMTQDEEINNIFVKLFQDKLDKELTYTHITYV